MNVDVMKAREAARNALEVVESSTLAFPGLMELLIVNVVLCIGVSLVSAALSDWLKGDEKPVMPKEMDEALAKMEKTLRQSEEPSEEQIDLARHVLIERLAEEGLTPQEASQVFDDVLSALIESRPP